MKNLHNKLIILLFIVLIFPNLSSSQDSLIYEPSYGVFRNYPPLSITKEKLQEADSLIHLNEHYKSSWIEEYISVEILTSNKGDIKKAMSKSDLLSQEQKNNMKMADLSTEIRVLIRYMPENNMEHNDPKEINFTFSVEPEIEAKYPGGQQKLQQYLKESLMSKIPKDSLAQYQLSAVTFTVDEEGLITNPHITWPWDDDEINQLLLETICNMPKWKPAEYANGTKVKQEFALTVGDMKSCAVNFLNIRQE